MYCPGIKTRTLSTALKGLKSMYLYVGALVVLHEPIHELHKIKLVMSYDKVNWTYFLQQTLHMKWFARECCEWGLEYQN
jgi:hypothetical protein